MFELQIRGISVIVSVTLISLRSDKITQNLFSDILDINIIIIINI